MRPSRQQPPLATHGCCATHQWLPQTHLRPRPSPAPGLPRTHAQVNADTHRSLGERFDVKGFPSIKYFAPGQLPSKDTAAE